MKKLTFGLLAPLILASSLSVAFAQGTPAPAFNAACARTALEKRDYISNSATDAFVVSFKSAVSQRATSLAAAFAMPTAKDRKAAVRNAMKQFRSAKRAARGNYDNTLRQASRAYISDLKACGDSNTVDQGVDEDNL